MNTPLTTAIIGRFFQAVDFLIRRGTYNSYYHFGKVNGFEYRVIVRIRTEPDRNRFQLEWIVPLLEYGFNLNWMFTGQGNMFTLKYVPKARERNENINRVV